MDKYTLALLIKEHKKKLNDMVAEGKPYEEILKQIKNKKKKH